MAEFSTTKITPTDDVQIPSINGQVAGYQENDELKSYVLGTIPTDVSGHTADITGIRGTSLDYDPDSTTYTKGATCILNHIVYRAKQLIPSPAGAFDSSKWEEVSLHEIARKVATNTDAITSLSDKIFYAYIVSSLSIQDSTWITDPFDLPAPSVLSRVSFIFDNDSQGYYGFIQKNAIGQIRIRTINGSGTVIAVGDRINITGIVA